MLLFSLQLSNAGGQYAVALIGAAFLAAYAIWRVYGLLIPGGILLVLVALGTWLLIARMRRES